MQFLLPFLLSAMLFVGCKTKQIDGPGNAKEYTVSGQVMMTRSYCGGAAPSEQILQNLRTPVPFTDLTLHVRTSNYNDLKLPLLRTTKTDAEGKFSFKLPAGEYCIIIDEKVKMPDPKSFPSETIHYDEACHRDWIGNCDAVVTVGEADVAVAPFTLHQRCFVSSFSKCVRYVGPMPP